jgi:hypothetical protein
MGNYDAVATAATPLLAIYLIDVSGSMGETLSSTGGKTKIDLVNSALEGILRVMMRRSMKGEVISPRYGLSLVAYSSGVTDVYGKTLNIEEALQRGLPVLSTDSMTDTNAAFEYAYNLLVSQLPGLDGCPAPMVCHLTDGQFNRGPDPRPIVKKIQSLSNSDGNVIVENIYVGDQLTRSPIADIQQWQGIADPNELDDSYAKVLLEMSSPLPATYATELQNLGYNLRSGVPMLIPADRKELVELAFAMSGATKTN